MGKTIFFKHEEEDMNPSCIRVLIRSIDYHHRFQCSVQKILPQMRNRAKGHGACNISSKSCDIAEDHEEKILLSSKSKKKQASSKRRYVRACIKKLFSHPVTKEVNDKVLGIQRNFSLDHYCLDVSSNWGHPVIFIPGNKDIQSIKFQGPTENDKFEEYRHLVKVEKKLRPLMKSRSFPAANLSQRTWLKSSKLNHKRTENWCHKRVGKFVEPMPLIKNTLNYCYKDLKLVVSAENVAKSGHRRSYSLNELLDKCTLFLEGNLGKERRLHTCASLKLENEDNRRSPSFSNPNFFSERTLENKKPGAQETDDLDETDATISANAEEHDQLTVEYMKSTTEQTNNNSPIRFSESPSAVTSFPSQDKASAIQKQESAEGLEKDSDIWDKSLASCAENLECSRWHSLDKPQINSLFEEIKVFLQQELKCLEENPFSSWHYQILLDLVNEELVRLHDRSSSYYPKALSRSCHICRFPVGNKILEEVCSSISALMNLMQEEKEWIDCVVDLDLKRGDSWMNLQWESEFVLLDVEKIIFNELLEELQ